MCFPFFCLFLSILSLWIRGYPPTICFAQSTNSNVISFRNNLTDIHQSKCFTKYQGFSQPSQVGISKCSSQQPSARAHAISTIQRGNHNFCLIHSDRRYNVWSLALYFNRISWHVPNLQTLKISMRGQNICRIYLSLPCMCISHQGIQSTCYPVFQI